MPKILSFLMPVEDVFKAKEFFVRLGFKVYLEAGNLHGGVDEEVNARQGHREPDAICMLEDDAGMHIELVQFKGGFSSAYGGAEPNALCVVVDSVPQTWESLQGVPGVRPINPPSRYETQYAEAAFKEAFEKAGRKPPDWRPKTNCFISVDLGREDGRDLTFEFLDVYKAE